MTKVTDKIASSAYSHIFDIVSHQFNHQYTKYLSHPLYISNTIYYNISSHMLMYILVSKLFLTQDVGKSHQQKPLGNVVLGLAHQITMS